MFLELKSFANSGTGFGIVAGTTLVQTFENPYREPLDKRRSDMTYARSSRHQICEELPGSVAHGRNHADAGNRYPAHDIP